MAAGDIVSEIDAAVAAAASLTFQPGAGVEVMVTEVGSNTFVNAAPNAVPDVIVKTFDGAQQASYRTNASCYLWDTMKLFLNNSIYLVITNTSGGATNIGWTGIQTK